MGGDCDVTVSLGGLFANFGEGVAKGLMVAVPFASADLGWRRSGDSALRSNGEPGSALFGLPKHFLVAGPGVRDDPGE